MVPQKVLRTQALREFHQKEIVEVILIKDLMTIKHLSWKATEINRIAFIISQIGTQKMTVLIDKRGMINQADETEEVVNLDPDPLEGMTPAATMNLIRITQQGLTKELENLPDQTLILQKEMTKKQLGDDSLLMKLLCNKKARIFMLFYLGMLCLERKEKHFVSNPNSIIFFLIIFQQNTSFIMNI